MTPIGLQDDVAVKACAGKLSVVSIGNVADVDGFSSNESGEARLLLLLLLRPILIPPLLQLLLLALFILVAFPLFCGGVGVVRELFVCLRSNTCDVPNSILIPQTPGEERTGAGGDISVEAFAVLADIASQDE